MNIQPARPVANPQPEHHGLTHVGWTWTVPTKDKTGKPYTLRVFSHSPHVEYESTPIYADVPKPVSTTQEILL